MVNNITQSICNKTNICEFLSYYKDTDNFKESIAHFHSIENNLYNTSRCIYNGNYLNFNI